MRIPSFLKRAKPIRPAIQQTRRISIRGRSEVNSLPLSPALLIPVTAYLLGSIPFGLLVVKALGGPDIRAIGSGNIGAASVPRTAGKFAGILTLLLDAGKGYAAVWLAAHYSRGNIRWMMLAAVCAIVGHMFPVWLDFNGGKGGAPGP